METRLATRLWWRSVVFSKAIGPWRNSVDFVLCAPIDDDDDNDNALAELPQAIPQSEPKPKSKPDPRSPSPPPVDPADDPFAPLPEFDDPDDLWRPPCYDCYAIKSPAVLPDVPSDRDAVDALGLEPLHGPLPDALPDVPDDETFDDHGDGDVPIQPEAEAKEDHQDYDDLDRISDSLAHTSQDLVQQQLSTLGIKPRSPPSAAAAAT